MYKKMHLVLVVCFVWTTLFATPNVYSRGKKFFKDSTVLHAYYLSSAGNDNNAGSTGNPWRSVDKINSLQLRPGDTVFLRGGDTFKGTLALQTRTAGLSQKPIIITSYGNGNAVIDADSGTALALNQSSYINIQNISCKGIGRKSGNTKDGIAIRNCTNISIKNIDVCGFQKSGVQVYCSNNVNINNVVAQENGFAGIFISGNIGKDSCSNIVITNCKAKNNPGDPTELNNHSGNGILAGFCKNVLIDHCTATNNGWDMPRIGNGPVGIWCYEADSVIIQHCISYQNKTSKGGEDGGGYDLDGGVTNSVIQYCLSYGNAGSAFGIFQYAGASNWHDNTIRFCISENDGKISAAHAGAYVWNSSHDSSQFKNLLFYNNTIYNDDGAAFSYSVESEHANFKFYNNIFIAADELLRGNYSGDVFLANDWFSFKHSFNIDSNYNFQNWCAGNNKEQLNRVIKGLNVWPPLKVGGNTMLTDVNQLSSFNDYKIITASPVTQAGIDLHRLYNINTGNADFNGLPVKATFIGACHY